MHLFRAYRWVIISLVVVAVAAALLFSYLTPVYYDTSISFAINRINRQETGEYQYDGYYAIQASDLFSQTVMSWFLTPSVLLEMYDQAGIDPKIASIEELSSRIKAKKYSPQNIVVRYKERDQATADALGQSIISVTQKKAELANQTTDNKALFEVSGAKPVIVQKKPNILMNTLIGLIGGFIISLVAAYLIDYWRTGALRENQPH
jgi:capsular polysaccharide biosynthesis protein